MNQLSEDSISDSLIETHKESHWHLQAWRCNLLKEPKNESFQKIQKELKSQPLAANRVF